MFIAILLIVVSSKLTAQEEFKKISEIISKFYEKSMSYQTIEYKESLFNDGEFAETIVSYFEKAPLDTIIGLRFETIDQLSKVIYNTSELFAIGMQYSPKYYLPVNEYDKIKVTKPFPAVKGYAGSYPAYAKALHAIDKIPNVNRNLLADSIVDGYNCYQLHYHFNNKRIMGDTLYVFPENANISFDHTFFIEKETFLLRQVLFSNSFGNKSKSKYSDYIFNKAKSKVLWNLSDYKNIKEYVRYEYKLIKIGSTMPDFKAKNINQEPIDQSFFKGKVCLLFFWNTGCAISKRTNSTINRIMNKYPDILVYGINNEEPNIDKINRYKKNEKLEFHLLLGNRELAKAFGVNAWPSILIFDKSSKLKYVYQGYKGELESNIDKVIELTDK